MPRIKKLLVANRGEIATRVIRSARERDVDTVAVYSEPDADATFVHAADQAVPLLGASPAETYLRADLVIAAARHVGADAVHPGYGFLSENADFAEACAEAGITFIGPPPAAIRAMGSKTAAKQLMAEAGVPVLPGIVIDENQEFGADLAERAAGDIGFPLLVKAAYGGGGRGMRIVESADELESTVAAARREAVSAFGNGAVFLERLVIRPRHIEVQVFADSQGQVVHLFERECSIQRRYQKIIEEAPSPVVDEELRSELGAAAVAAAKAIGYVGAGTVEFVMDPSGEFYFLEVNTRLQVEHPVTELVTGLDLVKLQIAVAEGEPLPRSVTEARLSGHAIEARLYAEDVAAGYLPATGDLHLFEVPQLPGLRVDSGVRSGSQVSVHYDPMLAKVIAYGATRSEAARLLSRALSEARVHGVVTNRDLLVGVLREEEFLAGQIDTGYLERHSAADLMAADPHRDQIHAAAVALADQAARRAAVAELPGLPSGWRNVPNAPQWASYAPASAGDQDAELSVSYRITGSSADVTVAGVPLGNVVLHSCSRDQVDLVVDGTRHRVLVARAGDERFADSRLGASHFIELPRFPDAADEAAAGSLLAPMPGTVVRVEVEAGAAVETGEVLVVLEAMKMEHAVRAPQGGVVAEVKVAAGDTVDQGTLLAVVKEAEGD
ncbi:acetyl/propionyl/methylcrotonyl-CoA carboxylase subunit alpha [Nocardioides sp. NPDC057767]|uniref:acetyl/propionyl/methylcrotonyl-CoA carboxylase subunit alpha n=1 Tax=unclassified Nocardioides TaxID=2615069 RepID=UPI00332B4C5B